MRRSFFGLVLAAGLAACAHAPGELVQTEGMPGQLEPIHAAAFTRDLAVFRVSSNGCTDKADVKPFITRLKDSAVITLRRLDEDRCTRPVRDGVQLQWTFEELGLPPGANVVVNNPYLLNGEEGVTQ
ncbi:MAG TPA: lipoprotein [Brevundimonas sp.]